MIKIFNSIIAILFGKGVYRLNKFTLPADLEFIDTIKKLDTPQKICIYMKENFVYKTHLFYTPSPYDLWKSKKGDCNDFSTFGIFVANYHGYETYQIKMYFYEIKITHALTVYKENSKYSYSSNQDYFPIQANTFQEVVGNYDNYDYRYRVKNYKIYDYAMNEIIRM